MDIVLLFLRREVRDIRGNARVWPLYLILPVIGIGLPALFAVLGTLALATVLSMAWPKREPVQKA